MSVSLFYMCKHPILFLLGCCLCLSFFSVMPAWAQSETTKSLGIKKANTEIKLDGVLDEADWTSADVADAFQQSYPDDQAAAASKTEVRMTYDDRFLYVGAVCYDEVDGDFVIQSLKRDFSFPITDAFAIFLNPQGDERTGYSFAVNPDGVERDGLVQSGGQFGVTTSWNAKWWSAVQKNEDAWVVEMAIPFKSFGFDPSKKVWRINFARNDLKRPETSTWQSVPTQNNVASLNFTGELLWDKPPRKTGGNVSLIPYVTASASRDLEDGDGDVSVEPNAGMDAKIALSSSMNLDLTVNPDFAQVEVDRQVTNLDRVQLFFPEQRQFFVENSDLFNLGVSPIRPFFSRRIGLGVPILFGARLTGNLNEKWRMGLMNIQTEGVPGGVQSQNFGMFSLQRQIGKRSAISGFVVNRQAFDGYQFDGDDRNTLAGAEFNYQSNNKLWTIDGFYHQSFTKRDDGSEALSNNAFDRASSVLAVRYRGRNLYSFITAEYMGGDHRADVGFLQELYQRNDETGEQLAVPYVTTLHNLGYRWFLDNSPQLRSIGIDYTGKFFVRPDFSFLDRDGELSTTLQFIDRSELSVSFNNYKRQLLYPTNITGKMDSLLQPALYKYQDAGISYSRSKLNRLYGSVSALYGGFYNGSKLTLRTDVNYRLQPWGIIGVNFNYNQIEFPEGYGDSQLLLIAPRLELTFTRTLFLTTFLQYNTQADNFNVNTRLQWRFAPLSDVFLVFTDNVNTLNGMQKNWGLVLKVNYWLSL